MSESLSPWLALREAADHAARSEALTRAIASVLPRDGTLRILDLATGTGSNVRYLSPFLRGPQEWLLVDTDAGLLAEASTRVSALNGVRAETRCMNLGPLDRPEIFSGRDLVTASALLDLVSERWLRQLAAHCRAAGAAVLFALSYDGRSACSPAETEDEAIRELMNRHQKTNDKGFGVAGGPDAVSAADRCFAEAGYQVRRATSDWSVPSESRELQRQLFEGWAQAAVEVAPDRSGMVSAWLARRLAHVTAGRSTVIVGHEDLIGQL